MMNFLCDFWGKQNKLFIILFVRRIFFFYLNIYYVLNFSIIPVHFLLQDYGKDSPALDSLQEYFKSRKWLQDEINIWQG